VAWAVRFHHLRPVVEIAVPPSIRAVNLADRLLERGAALRKRIVAGLLLATAVIFLASVIGGIFR
jgi:hypothetical protein